MKKNSVALIVSLIAIASMLGYVSYSYIAMGITNDEFNILTTTSNGLVFTADGGGSFNNTVTDDNMAQGNQNNVVVETNDTMNITLQTDGKKGICCTYDIKWVWDNASDAKGQYIKTVGSNNEFVLQGSYITSYNGSNGENITVNGEANNSFTKQLPDYNAASNSLFTGTICNKNSDVLSTNVKQAYTLHTRFYNLTINQDALKGKTFQGHIQITNINCNKSNN